MRVFNDFLARIAIRDIGLAHRSLAVEDVIVITLGRVRLDIDRRIDPLEGNDLTWPVGAAAFVGFWRFRRFSHGMGISLMQKMIV